MKYLACIIALNMCGCISSFFGPPTHSLIYDAAGEIHTHKRITAIQHMYSTCSGDYTVISEYPIGKVEQTDKSTYNLQSWEIKFICVGE